MTAKQEIQAKEKQEIQQEATREGRFFRPDVDIFERQDALVLVADVPGSSNEKIHLDLNDNALDLTAAVTPVDEQWKPIYLEYEVGGYERQFRVGQIVDVTKIAAHVKDGVLTVTLPKVEKALPRKIEVTTEP